MMHIVRISNITWRKGRDKCGAVVQEVESSPSPSNSLPASLSPKPLGYGLGGSYLAKWISKPPEDSVHTVPPHSQPSLTHCPAEPFSTTLSSVG